MVKKAVIAAAGRGTRFLPVSKAYPKELLPILAKPAIQYLVEELIGAGIEKIAIVHLHGNQAIKRYFSPDLELEAFLKKVNKKDWLGKLRRIGERVEFRFIPQPRRYPYGSGTPVLAAKSFIGKEPFVYVYGDDLVLEKSPGAYLSKLRDLFEKKKAVGAVGVQALSKEKVPWYGTIEFKKKNRDFYQVGAIREKLSFEKAPSNLTVFGRFVLSPAIISILADQKLSQTNELFLTDAITTLAEDDLVLAKELEAGKWLTIGTPESWLEANLEFKKFFSPEV